MNRTNIPWCDLTWNPITGCTRGCDYCYARKVVARFGDIGIDPNDSPTVPVAAFDFRPLLHPDRLDEPLRRKKPSVIFLGSMGDLFDPAFPDEFRDRVFATVAAAPQHTFMVLTKRVEEMRRYFTTCDMRGESIIRQMVVPRGHIKTLPEWPLPNLWLGVTVTNQADADKRIPLLLDTPAAHRFVSVEPMLGPVDFGRPEDDDNALWAIDSRSDGVDYPALDLVIVGAKTPGKPLHEQYDCEACKYEACGDFICEGDQPLHWLRSLRDQCLAAGVPLHYKHGGTNPSLDGIVYDWRPDTAQSAEEEE